jgi:hypothetical protein
VNTVLEAPPQPKRDLGCCLGKGCLILVIFLFLLGMTFIVGGYFGVRRAFTSTEPRELPQVQTSEEQQQAVLQRWENFEKEVRTGEVSPAPAESSPSPQPNDVAAPSPSPAAPTIEFTATDINQLIAANRKARGKAFVSIAGDIGHVQVSIPISKIGFSGRHLNADFDVRSSPDGDPRKIQVTTTSPSGVQVPERVFNLLLGLGTVRSYVDRYINQYASEYEVSKVRITDGRVILEAGGGR